MRRGRLAFIALIAALIAVTAALYLGQMKPPAPAALPAGALAELLAARFDDASGKAQSIAQWRGKTLVINFWASWCPPCREEMPAFSRLHSKYAANGVQFVGIAIDTEQNVANYSKTQKLSYPLLVANTGGAELTRQLGNSSLGLPYTVVFSASGAVLMARLGRVSEPELDALLAQQIAKN